MGAFKLCGGLVYLRRLIAARDDLTGIVCATRGSTA
jgi:hypothetical protein